jgi:methylthioribulose-1-phosphate dehydratase
MSMIDELIACVRELGARGLTPATSSNFSVRLDRERIAITISGRDKTKLVGADLMEINLRGQPLDPALKSSAETALHTQIYREIPDARCVLHTHSLAQTVASKLFAASGGIHFRDYELLKGLSGHDTHEDEVVLPVVRNSQDMNQIMDAIAQWLQPTPRCPGYLIEGHGIYTWGTSINDAKRHLEVFEFLLGAELELSRLRAN